MSHFMNPNAACVLCTLFFKLIKKIRGQQSFKNNAPPLNKMLFSKSMFRSLSLNFS